MRWAGYAFFTVDAVVRSEKLKMVHRRVAPSIVSMCHCGNVPLWQCAIVSMCHCGNVPLWKCAIVAMRHCGNVPSSQCATVALLVIMLLIIWRQKCELCRLWVIVGSVRSVSFGG